MRFFENCVNKSSNRSEATNDNDASPDIQADGVNSVSYTCSPDTQADRVKSESYTTPNTQTDNQTGLYSKYQRPSQTGLYDACKYL